MNCSWCYKQQIPATYVSVYGCWACGKISEVYFCAHHMREMTTKLDQQPDAYGHANHKDLIPDGMSCLPYMWEHGKLP